MHDNLLLVKLYPLLHSRQMVVVLLVASRPHERQLLIEQLRQIPTPPSKVKS